MNIPFSNSGAIPALRGFRNQFLYTLRRILVAEEEEIVFPELQEDYSVKVGENLIEVVQIKDHTEPLTISDFNPRKEDSFFRRSIQILKTGVRPEFSIISFGPLGKELNDFKNGKKKDTLANKMVDTYGYVKSDIEALLSKLSIVKVEEKEVQEQVNGLLNDTLIGIDTQIGGNLLLFWLYQIAENGGFVTKNELVKKIGDVGQFISERHQFLTEYGRSIIPLSFKKTESEDLRNLQEQFLSGIAANFQHILAGLDIFRPSKIAEIDQGFAKNKIIVLHGASGQGKSTIAYRYIYERFPEGYAYLVPSITDLGHTLNISQTIRALARPFDHPFLIFIDVAPGNENWVSLSQSLAEIDNCRILIAIREEDLNRSNSLAEFVQIGQIKLDFDKVEAESLFQQVSRQASIPHLLNFTDAWSQFGGQGPLLEFVYLLRKGERLRDRLTNQIKHIQERAIQEQEPNQLKLLKYVAAAGAHDCRVDLKSLLQLIQLADPKRTIAFFQEEYLIRSSQDGKYLEALHPIRASLMAKIMFDPVIEPVQEIFAESLPSIVEEDWKNFVLQYAYHYGWSSKIQSSIQKLIPNSWKSCRDLFRGLNWCGVQKHVEQNDSLLSKLKNNFPNEYSLSLVMYIAGSEGFSNDGPFLNNEPFKKAAEILDQFSSMDSFYSYTKEWLQVCSFPTEIDTASANEISALGYVQFWLGHFEIPREISKNIIDKSVTIEGSDMPLDAYADLLLGLNHGSQYAQKVAQKILPNFMTEFQIRKKVPRIEDDGQQVTIHMVFELNNQEDEDSDFYKGRAVQLLRLVRRAIPNREKYASQGYGHAFRDIPLPYDDSNKNISSKHLPIQWLNEASSIFLNITKRKERLEDWGELLEDLTQTKENVTQAISAINSCLIQIVKQNNLTKAYDIIPDIELLSGIINLPKSAVDKFGFSGDFPRIDELAKPSYQIPLLHILDPQLEPSIKAIKDFHFSIRNFLQQAKNSLALKEASQDWTKQDWKEKEGRLRELGFTVDDIRLSKYNLAEAWKHLPAYQQALDYLTKSFSSVDAKQLDQTMATDLEKLLLNWTYFMEKKLRKGLDLSILSTRKETAIINEFERKLQYRLNNLQKKEMLEGSEIVESESSPGRWYLILYIQSWLQVIVCHEIMRKKLLESLEPAPYNSFRRVILEKHIQEIWIIPLHDDFLLTRNTQQFNLYQILNLSDTEINPATSFGQITDDMIQELEVEEASKIFPSFGNPERLHTLVSTINAYLNHLLQLKPLASEGKNLLIDIQIKQVILDSHKKYQEIKQLLDILIEDVKSELASSDPFIPDTLMMEYVGEILAQLHRVDEMVSLLQENEFDMTVFDIIEEVNSQLDDLKEEVFIVYSSWLEMVIHRHLQ